MAKRPDDAETSTGTCNNSNCPDHYHADDDAFVSGKTRQRPQARPMDQPSTSSGGQASDSTIRPENTSTRQGEEKSAMEPEYDPDDHGLRRIIRNFTPS